jgi:hypothetical protein
MRFWLAENSDLWKAGIQKTSGIHRNGELAGVASSLRRDCVRVWERTADLSTPLRSGRDDKFFATLL